MDKKLVSEAIALFDSKYPELKSRKHYCINYKGFPTIVIDGKKDRIDENVLFAVDLKKQKIQPFSVNPTSIEVLSRSEDELELVDIRKY